VTAAGPTAGDQGADARHAARSGAVQVITAIVQALLATTQIVFAHLYGKSVYGAYVSALAVLEIFYRGGAGGADKAMLRYVAASRAAGNSAGVRSALGTGLRLNLVVGGLFALGLVIGAPWIASGLGQTAVAPALRILAPLPLLTGGLWVLVQASLAARSTKANFYVRGLAEPALLLIAGLVAWRLGGGLPALAAAHVVGATLTLMLAIVVVRGVLRPDETRRVLTAPTWRGFARFSLPIGASEMLNAVVQRADIVILTTLKGVQAAAIYGAADLFTRSIASIRYAFDSILAGVMSETLHLGETARMEYNLRLATRWVVSLAAPVAVTVVVLRHELLGMFGFSYVGGADTLLALAVAYVVTASLGLTGWILVVAGHSRLSFGNNLVGSLFNVPAAYLLINRFGAVGAGYAALGTAVVSQALIVGEVAILKKVHPFGAGLWKPIAAGLAAAAVEAVVHAEAARTWLRVPAAILAGLVTYALALFAFRLPSEERQILSRNIRRLRTRRAAAAPRDGASRP
jgi:O-antigen/teichoic acid export membrane protein